MENNENKDLLLDESPKEEQVEVVENNGEIKQEDFVLVQSDTKIYDKKLETKPTTFLKDALKRFRKNKSSVVGAIILGILILLTIIVPLVSSKNIDKVSKPEAFLAPKLFNAGTGFWDGTVKRDHIVYDVIEEKPTGYIKTAVRDIVVDSTPTLLDQASTYGHNGYVMFENENTASKQTVSLYTKNVEFDPAQDYIITIEFVNEDKVQNKDLGEYEITIATIKETNVRANGMTIEWKRRNEGADAYRTLDLPLVKVRLGEEYIEWAYLGGEYQATTVKIAELLEGESEDTTIEVQYDAELNAVQYRKSYEGEFTTILEPNLSDIDARVNLDKEVIEWKFTSESDSKWRQYEALSNLDDGTGSKFSHHVLKAFSKEYGTITINVAEEMNRLGLDKIQGHLCFNLKGADTRQYILIKSISVETSAVAPDDESSQEYIDEYKEVTEFIERLNFKDATQMVIRENTANDYWYCTGRKGIHNAEYYYCSFRYDTYLAVYDLYPGTVYVSELDDYKKKGWLTYDYKYTSKVWEDEITKEQLDEYVANEWLSYEYKYDKNTGDYTFTYKVLDSKKCPVEIIDPETIVIDPVSHKLVKFEYAYYEHYEIEFTYEILSSECPIEEIDLNKISPNSITNKLSYVGAKFRTYAKMGYKNMPRFLFGTNASGNDLFKKAFTGLRTSLVLGVCTAAFCFIFGLVWGSISGYFGGNVDLFMERFCEILSGVPWIVIMTLCILHLGNNFFTFFLALCMTGWMGTAARTRTQFYRFKGREYVLASRTLGASDRRLIFRHILPNSLGTIITGSVLMIPSVIFSESTLAYLNLGLQGVQAFGVMMAENQKYLEKAPYLVVFPAVIIALMMISFNLFGNGLRDAINPTLKGSD